MTLHKHQYRFTTLQITEVTFEDSLLDVFREATDEIEYLSITDSEIASNIQVDKIRNSRFSHICRINTDKLKMIRTKFNVWDAIGFIGGTHDGIYLIVGILLRPISACLF